MGAICLLPRGAKSIYKRCFLKRNKGTNRFFPPTVSETDRTPLILTEASEAPPTMPSKPSQKPIGFPSQIIKPREAPHRTLTPKKGMLKRHTPSPATDPDHPPLPNTVHFFYNPNSGEEANLSRQVHGRCLVTGRLVRQSTRSRWKWKRAQFGRDGQRNNTPTPVSGQTNRVQANEATQKQYGRRTEKFLRRYQARQEEVNELRAQRDLLEVPRPGGDKPEEQKEWDLAFTLKQARRMVPINAASCPLSVMAMQRAGRMFHPAMLASMGEMVVEDVRSWRANPWRNLQNPWGDTQTLQFRPWAPCYDWYFRAQLLLFVKNMLSKQPREGFGDGEVIAMAFSAVIFLAYGIRPFVVDALLGWQYQYLKQLEGGGHGDAISDTDMGDQSDFMSEDQSGLESQSDMGDQSDLENQSDVEDLTNMESLTDMEDQTDLEYQSDFFKDQSGMEDQGATENVQMEDEDQKDTQDQGDIGDVPSEDAYIHWYGGVVFRVPRW